MKSHSASFDVVAIFLIFSEPFFELIYTNRFVLEAINLLILAGYGVITLAIAWFMNRFPNRIVYAVILTALITLFLDVRANIFVELGTSMLLVIAATFAFIWLVYSNASKILIVVFGVIFVFIFNLPVFPRAEEFPSATQPAARETANLPTYVHLVLDEHIGTEALDEQITDQGPLKRAIKDLYIANGFRLFGRAYSEYFDTLDALPAMLNAYSGGEPNRFYTDTSEASNTVLQNTYLRDLHDAGYDIRVYQTSFVDFCAEATDIIHQCLTYSPFVDVSSEALADFDWRDKLTITLAALWRRSSIKRFVQQTYRRVAISTDERPAEGQDLEQIFMLGTIPTMPIFDRLIADVAAAPPGTMFFAHLMIPHHPYTVDRSCRIRRPLLDWKLNSLPTALADGRSNTAQSRAARYEDYVDQTHCTLVKINQLFDALKSAGKFDGATIIVHGDHGSKISRFRLRKFLRDKLSDRDYYDGFSTLFAAKAPHIAPGYDLRMLSIERLLQHAVDTGSASPTEPENHFVYLRDEEPSSSFIKVPMPEIPVGPTRPPRDGAE